MPEEIERKFLVASEGWRDAADGGRRLRQAYLARTDALVVRVRIADGTEDGTEATLTIKGVAPGRTRQEFEYPVPVEHARALMALALGRAIEKRRYTVPAEPGEWEIDVFEGEHAGLVIAEIELAHEDAGFARPGWLGEEVTDDARYYNAALAGLSGRDEA